MKKLIISLSLGISVLSLSACSSNNQDQFYTDADSILKLIQTDLENGKPYSLDDFNKIDAFMKKYQNLKMNSPEMKAYLDTIGHVETYANETYKGIK